VAFLGIGGMLFTAGVRSQTCEEIALENVAQAQAEGHPEAYQEGVYAMTMTLCHESRQIDESWPE
jgi:hypothetical protein